MAIQLDRFRFPILVLLSSLLFVSCSRSILTARVNRMCNSVVTFPSSLDYCNSERDSSSYINLQDATPLFVIYIDQKECTTCKSDHLSHYNRIIEIGKVTQLFKPVIIISPRKGELHEVLNSLNRLGGNLPVFIDHNNRFKSHNPTIPSDSRFHQFLLDKEHKPVFIGDPEAGAKLMNLFMAEVDKLKHEQ